MKTLWSVLAALLAVALTCIAAPQPKGVFKFQSVGVMDILAAYRDMTGVELAIAPSVAQSTAKITLESNGPTTASEAAQMIERALIEQAAVVITRLGDRRASVAVGERLALEALRRQWRLESQRISPAYEVRGEVSWIGRDGKYVEGGKRTSGFTGLSGRAQPYVEVRAQIATTTYEEDGAETATAQTNSFSVVCVIGLEANRWRIDTDYLRGAESAWHFDGTNVFEAIHVVAPTSARFSNAVHTGLSLAVVPFDIARSNLTINVRPSRDGHPRGHLGVNLPWLAFCSGAYLKQSERVIPLPDAILRHTPDGFAYSDKTQTFNDQLGLPQTVELFTSKSLYEVSVQRDDFAGNRDLRVWKNVIAAAPEGALKFRYCVTRSTNFLNRIFPLEFEFTHNDRRKDGTWFVVRRGQGIVTALRESSPPKHVFDSSLQQTIVDYRFPDAAKPNQAIIYRFTNSALAPTLADVQNIKSASEPAR